MKRLHRLLSHYFTGYRGYSRETWVILGAVFVNNIAVMVNMFLALYLKTQLNYPINLTGWMVAAYGAGFVLGGYVAGHASDRLTPRHVALFCLTLTPIPLLVLAWVTSPYLIALTAFGVGFFSGGFKTTGSVWLLNQVKSSQRVQILGVRRVAVNLGFAVAGALGGVLVAIHFKLIFYFDALLVLAAAILLWKLSTPLSNSLKNEPSSQPKNLMKRQSPWHDSIFILLWLLTLLVSFVYTQVFTAYPIYLHQVYRIMLQHFSIIFALNGILIVFIQVPLIRCMNQFNQYYVCAVGALLICLGFAILPLGTSLSFAIFSVFIWTLGEIIIFAPVVALAVGRASDANRGQYMGTFQTTMTLSQLMGPPLGAMIYHHLSPNVLWFSIGGLGVVVTIGFLFTGMYAAHQKFRAS